MAGFSFNTNPASSSSPSPFSFASSSSSTSPFSFSSNPSSSPSLFGSTTSSAAPSPSFGFGTTSSPASGSPFGGSGLFGSTSSSTTTTTTSLFGSGLSSSSTTFGATSIFGASSASASVSASTAATAVSSPFGSGLLGASPSVVAESTAAASSPATSFPSLFGSSSSSSSISSSTTAQSTSSSTPAFSFLSSSSSTSFTSAPSFSFPSAATSAPSFSFSTTSAVVDSTGTVGSSGSASLFAGSSSSSSSGFSFGNVTGSSGLASNATTGASSSASTTTPSFAAFGATSSSTTASTSTGLLSSFASPATAAGTSSSFMGFQTSSKSVGTPTPASQPHSTAASSLFGDSASLTTTSTVTTTTAQTSSALVVSSSNGTTASVSTAVATASKLPSEITGQTVEEVSIQRPKSSEVVTREVIEKKKAELAATQVKIPSRSGACGDKGAGPVEKEPAQTAPGSRLKSMLTAPPTRVPVYQKTLRKVADSTGYKVTYATGSDEPVQTEPTAEELEATRKAHEALTQAEESRKLAEIVEKERVEEEKQVAAEKEKPKKEKFAHDMIREEPVTEELVIVALDSSSEGDQGGGDGKNVEGAPKEIPQVKESEGGSPKDGDKHAGGSHKGATQIKEVQGSGPRNEARVQSAPSGSHGGGMDTIYVPRWNIEAGTRFLNPLVAEDFIDCAIPPAERAYQQGLGRDQLMSDMCMSTILMASSLNEVRRREREFAVEVDNLNRARGMLKKKQEKMEAEFACNKREVEEMKKKMLAKDAEINKLQRESVDAKKRWDDAHRLSNAEIQRAKEKIQSLEAEKSKHEALAAEHSKAIEERDSKLATALGDLQLKDQEIMKTTSQLSALETEKIKLEEENEVWGVEKASMQGLMDDAIAAQAAAQKDINWMMNEGVAGIFKWFWNEPKLGDQVAAIAVAAHKDGRRAGIDECFHIALNRKSIDECPLQDEDTEAAYLQELRLFEEIKFQVLDVVGECAKLPNPVRELRNFFEESDRLGEEALKKAADAAAGVGSSETRHDDDESSEELVDYDDELVGHGEEPAGDDEGTGGPDV